MGFKITHPLLPRRRLAWPLWHTSTRRQHVPPDRMSGTTDTTKWPRCLLLHCVLVEFTLSRGGFLTFWMDPAFIHLVRHSQGGGVTPADAKVKFPLLTFSVELLPEPLFIHMLGVFPDFYQCLNVVTPVGAEAVPLQMYFVYHSLELISLCWGKYTFSRLIALLDSCKEILPMERYGVMLCVTAF